MEMEIESRGRLALESHRTTRAIARTCSRPTRHQLIKALTFIVEEVAALLLFNGREQRGCRESRFHEDAPAEGCARQAQCSERNPRRVSRPSPGQYGQHANDCEPQPRTRRVHPVLNRLTSCAVFLTCKNAVMTWRKNR